MTEKQQQAAAKQFGKGVLTIAIFGRFGFFPYKKGNGSFYKGWAVGWTII